MQIVQSWPSDRPLPPGTHSVVAQGGTHLILITRFQQRRTTMQTLTWLITGGFAKGYRTQVLGVAAALSAIAMWAVGDMTLMDLIAKLPILLGGLGIAALGAKVDATASSPGVTKGAKAK
jgi:hypothetical protein